jgi:hypothetical protein
MRELTGAPYQYYKRFQEQEKAEESFEFSDQ